MTNAGVYLLENRQELLRIFNEIYSGRSIELLLNSKIEIETFEKNCCMDAVIIHQYNNSEVDFPVKYPIEISNFDEALALELYSIILCEEGVKEGVLKRHGLKYIPNPKRRFEYNNKYGSYIVN
jgi:hypothetical protein